MTKHCYLVVSNCSQKQQLGNLLRSATAFDVREVIVVGGENFGTFGSQNAHKYVKIHFCDTFQQVRLYLGESTHICGVVPKHSHCTSAQSIADNPFDKSTAFVIANETDQLTQEQMQICDFFVYIPQYSSMFQQLDSTVVSSIILHHFCQWAQFEERKFEESWSCGKFLVDDAPTRLELKKKPSKKARDVNEIDQEDYLDVVANMFD